MQVTPSLYNGGGEIFAFQLSETLANRGHDVCLVSVTEPDPRSPLFERLKTAPFEFVSLDKQSGNGVDLKIPFRILGRALAWKPEVVHTHLRALAYSFFLTPLGARKFHTVHSLADKECSKTTQRLYARLFGLGWGAVAISDTVKKSINLTYGIDSHIVNNGVLDFQNALGVAGGARNELGINETDSVLVHVGRLYETKNQLFLLRAFEAIARARPSVHLLLVGGDPVPGEPYLQLLQQKLADMPREISRRVHLLGVRSDIERILRSSDVFVLCSLHEGMPLTLLEAMSLGMKCVCTRVGGIPDAIDESNGWLVTPDDEAALAVALADALESAGNSRGKKARAVFESRFSMEKCAEAYEALYLQQLGVS